MLHHNTFRYRRWYPVAVAVVAAFVGGWVSAGTHYATKINKGLLTAFNVVGQHVFGAGVFNATPEGPPIVPSESIQLYFATDSQIPVAFDVFIPPNPIIPVDPCRVVAQLSVNTTGDVTMAYDSTTFPNGITVDGDANLDQLHPNVARCPATLPPGQDP